LSVVWGSARRAVKRSRVQRCSKRHFRLFGVLLRIYDALTAALAESPPVLLADAGDATNGGAIGDSTELLRAALRSGARRVLLSIRDAEAADAATRAGAGASVELTLGGGEPGSYNERTPVTAHVERLFDGEV